MVIGELARERIGDSLAWWGRRVLPVAVATLALGWWMG